MPNIIEITDFASPELDVFARLTEAQLRNRRNPEKGLFLAESPKVIAHALDAGKSPVRPGTWSLDAGTSLSTPPTGTCWRV